MLLFFLQGEALLPEGLSFICTSVALILISVSVLLVSDTPRTAETLTHKQSNLEFFYCICLISNHSADRACSIKFSCRSNYYGKTDLFLTSYRQTDVLCRKLKGQSLPEAATRLKAILVGCVADVLLLLGRNCSLSAGLNNFNNISFNCPMCHCLIEEGFSLPFLSQSVAFVVLPCFLFASRLRLFFVAALIVYYRCCKEASSSIPSLSLLSGASTVSFSPWALFSRPGNEPSMKVSQQLFASAPTGMAEAMLSSLEAEFVMKSLAFLVVKANWPRPVYRSQVCLSIINVNFTRSYC